jgi:DNA-directed RNA polymerase subunit H (RpoH/RPB5)
MENLYNAYCYTLQMLLDRKYITQEKKQQLEYNVKDFVNIININIAKLDITNIHTRNGQPAMVLFFNEDLKYNKTINSILELLRTRITDDIIDSNYIILVYKSTEDAAEIKFEDIYKKEKNFTYDNKAIQLFPSSYIAINIMNNIIMPKTELITDKKEQEELLLVGKSSMNTILLHDPVTRYYGATTGDIFKFIRKGNDGLNISWRRVA